MRRTTLMCMLLLASLNLPARDVIELEGTEVRGNQELPKMLYIVPWKQSELPEMSEPPLGSLIDEALMPVDRREFRREIRHYENLQRQPASAGK